MRGSEATERRKDLGMVWHYNINDNMPTNTNIKHAVSDSFTFIMTYISMSPKVIYEENCEGLLRLFI